MKREQGLLDLGVGPAGLWVPSNPYDSVALWTTGQQSGRNRACWVQVKTAYGKGCSNLKTKMNPRQQLNPGEHTEVQAWDWSGSRSWERHPSRWYCCLQGKVVWWASQECWEQTLPSFHCQNLRNTSPGVQECEYQQRKWAGPKQAGAKLGQTAVLWLSPQSPSLCTVSMACSQQRLTYLLFFAIFSDSCKAVVKNCLHDTLKDDSEAQWYILTFGMR